MQQPTKMASALKDVRFIELSAAKLAKQRPDQRPPNGQTIAVFAFVDPDRYPKAVKSGKRALMILGAFSRFEEAELHIKKVRERGFDHFDLYSADMNAWLEVPPPNIRDQHNADATVNFEYAQDHLRDIMNGHKQHNNDAAKQMEERLADGEALRTETRKRIVCRMKFNAVVAQLLEQVPLAPTNCSGLGCGPPELSVQQQQMKVLQAELEAEAKAAIAAEGRIAEKLAPKFKSNLTAMLRQRKNATDVADRRRAAEQRNEDLLQKQKDALAESTRRAAEHETALAARIQEMRDEAASSASVTNNNEENEANDEDTTIDFNTNPEEANLASYRRMVAKLVQVTPAFDPNGKYTRTAAQEQLALEEKRLALIEQLARKRREMREQQGDGGGGAATSENKPDPELIKLSIAHRLKQLEAQRLGIPGPDQAAFEAQTEALRQAHDERERGRILKDMRATLGKGQTTKPKGLQ
jgi:hypothetical protein